MPLHCYSQCSAVLSASIISSEAQQKLYCSDWHFIEWVVWFETQRILCFKYALARGENCLQRPDRFQHFFLIGVSWWVGYSPISTVFASSNMRAWVQSPEAGDMTYKQRVPTGRSSKGAKCDSKCLHGSSQQSVTPVTGNLAFSSGFSGNKVHTW